MPLRTVAVWFPGWPVTAAVVDQDMAPATQAAVLHSHRVVACSPSAQEAGVVRGMKRRTAQGICPQLLVFEADQGKEARLFELAASAVESVAAGIELLRPGLLVFPAAGPAAYCGSEEALLEKIIDHVADITGWECQVGVADGLLAALLAAQGGRVVASGAGARFLAPFPVSRLRALSSVSVTVTQDVSAIDELIEVLTHLGIRTLGEFAELKATAVVDRFGPAVAELHRLSQGEDIRLPVARVQSESLAVARACDPPLERVDQAAFVAKALAEQLQQKLVQAGLSCRRLEITARTDTGDELSRTWRHDGALGSRAMVDRARWQFDGWLNAQSSPAAVRAGALVEVGLNPIQVESALHHQNGLWGSAGENDVRAQRALARVQALFGEMSVLAALPSGGRHPEQKSVLVAWGSQPTVPRDPREPWPGAMLPPAPGTVLRESLAVELLDRWHQAVRVNGRGLLSAEPNAVVRRAEPRLDHRITAWAGPWSLDERWWREAEAQRIVRMQIVFGEGKAALAVLRQGQWQLEALYD